MFKEASKQKLRFVTAKGNLTVEQLWDLSIADLDTLAVSLEDAYNKSKGRSFVTAKTTKDKTIKLQFDVALEVLNTKVEEQQTLTEAKEIKEHNRKILELISRKKDGELEGKSIKQLEAMLK